MFYPDEKTRKLNFYSRFFETVEMDATFYKKFYLDMKKGLFIGLARATPDNFKFSVKVPETITHEKGLDVNKGVIEDLYGFIDKISPLKNTNKLGAIIIQLPPSFTITKFKEMEEFLNALTNSQRTRSMDYAVEFRNNTWNTEGTFELLRHYNIASVLTDSPSRENLEFLSDENNMTSKKLGVVRLHGRNTRRDHYWYDYLYNERELTPWVNKIKNIKKDIESVFVYFNNHYSGKAIVNALQFKKLASGHFPTKEESDVLEKAKRFLDAL